MERIGIQIEATDNSKAAFASLQGNLRVLFGASGEIISHLGGVSQSTQTLSNNLEETGKKSFKLADIFNSSFVKIGLGIGGAAAAYATFKSAVVGSITKAIESESVMRKMQTAVELSGDSWWNAKPKVEAFGKAVLETTRFTDEQAIGAIQAITQVTGNFAQGQQGATIAMDMAATGLFDLDSAVRAVAIAYEGNTMMLGRQIPALRESAMAQLGLTTSAEKAEYAIKTLTEKFGGAAEKDVQTFGGRMQQLQNNIGQLKESIGNLLIPILGTLAEKLVPVVSYIADLVDELRDLPKTLTIANEALNDANMFYNIFQKELIDTSTIALPNTTEQIGLFAEAMNNIGNNTNLTLPSIVSFNAEVDQLGQLLPKVNVVLDNTKNNARSLSTELNKKNKIEYQVMEIDTQLAKNRVAWDNFLNHIETSSLDHAQKLASAWAVSLPIGFTFPPEEETMDELNARLNGWSTTTKEAFDATAELSNGVSQGIESAFGAAFGNMIQAGNTWRDSARAAFNAFAGVALQAIAKTVYATITAEATKTAAITAGVTARIPIVAAEDALTVGSALKNIWHAVTSIFSWVAKLGPFGIAIGVGAVAVMMGIINSFKHFSKGGLVTGEAGEDRVPAMLTAGEYVLTAAQAQRLLPMLNSGSVTNSHSVTNFNINVGAGAQVTVESLMTKLIPALERAVAERKLVLA